MPEEGEDRIWVLGEKSLAVPDGVEESMGAGEGKYGCWGKESIDTGID